MADRTLSQDEIESLFASAPGEAESPSVQVAAASDSAERHKPIKHYDFLPQHGHR